MTLPNNGIPKPSAKPLITLLIEKLSDSVASVRDSATEVLGAIMKVNGERSMLAFLEPLDKLKATKITEAYQNALKPKSADTVWV